MSVKRLIVCEKNIAARRIAGILSNGNYVKKNFGKVPYYEFDDTIVIGLKGHIMKLDYPSRYAKWNAVNPKELIEVEPVKKISNSYVANAIKKLSEGVEEVIIATDYDREGELIGAEIIELLPKNVSIKRARFSAITPDEIKKAFSNLGELDINLAKAAEARQYIDLIWGASLTRFISLSSNQLGSDFLSVGRVQTPTLALIVEREKEIENFVPEPYWIIKLELEKDGAKFTATSKKIKDEEKARKIKESIGNFARVKKFDKKIVEEYPPPPFDTTTFLKEASYLGFSATTSMKIAEELYMNGCISYPRTDNTVYPSIPINIILSKLEKIFPDAKKVASMRRRVPTRGKKESHDHPPIYPVDACKLEGHHGKIYELIARRFMATVSKNAILEKKKAVLNAGGEEFNAEGLKIIEKNWREVYPYLKIQEKELPDMNEGEDIRVIKVKVERKETKPPKRYTQGSLLVEMEKLGLGTKSTRHEIIGKLFQRNYIRGKQITPTPAAIAVTEALKKGAEIITMPEMTAMLEEDMNRIADRKKTFEEVVEESKQILEKAFSTLEEKRQVIGETIKKAVQQQNYFGKCPKCGGNLVMRKSKNGKRFIGCSNYPRCTVTYPLPQKGSVFFEGEYCECGSPKITIIYGGKKWKKCADPNCN